VENHLDRIDWLVDEGREILTQAAQRGLAACLMGGVAIRVLLGETMPTIFERPYRDVDIFTRRSDARSLANLLTGRDWRPSREFNAIQVRVGLYFMIQRAMHTSTYSSTPLRCATRYR
jgi:hypothetical protein